MAKLKQYWLIILILIIIIFSVVIGFNYESTELALYTFLFGYFSNVGLTTIIIIFFAASIFFGLFLVSKNFLVNKITFGDYITSISILFAIIFFLVPAYTSSIIVFKNKIISDVINCEFKKYFFNNEDSLVNGDQYFANLFKVDDYSLYYATFLNKIKEEDGGKMINKIISLQGINILISRSQQFTEKSQVAGVNKEIITKLKNISFDYCK